MHFYLLHNQTNCLHHLHALHTNATHKTQTYIVCICVCAFVAATCEKFTSMCNSNRVYDLCAICMFKRNSNQIIALLVRTFIKLFYFSVGIMLTKQYEFFFDMYLWMRESFVPDSYDHKNSIPNETRSDVS